MTTTTTVGAADMDKPTIDTPEFRERLRSYGVVVAVNHESYKRLVGFINSHFAAHINSKLPAAAPADLSGLTRFVPLNDIMKSAKNGAWVRMSDVQAALSKVAAAAKEAPSDERQAFEARFASELENFGGEYGGPGPTDWWYWDDETAAMWEKWQARAHLTAPSLAAPEAVTCEHCGTRRPLHLLTCPVAVNGMAEGKKKEAPEPLRQLLIDLSNNTYFCGLHLSDDAKYAGYLREAEKAEQALIELFSAAPALQRESKAEAVGKVHYSRHTGDYEGVIYGDVKDGDLLYTRAAHPAAPSERVTPAQQAAQEGQKFTLAGYQYGSSFTPAAEADEYMRGEGREMFAKAADAAQEGQQDQAVDALTDERIESHWRSATQFGGDTTQSFTRYFARAIEAEVQRRCRAQRTTIEESKSEEVRKDAECASTMKLLTDPPHGAPDLYARLHQAMNKEVATAKEFGKLPEWFAAARGLLDFLASKEGVEDAREQPQGEAKGA